MNTNENPPNNIVRIVDNSPQVQLYLIDKRLAEVTASVQARFDKADAETSPNHRQGWLIQELRGQLAAFETVRQIIENTKTYVEIVKPS